MRVLYNVGDVIKEYNEEQKVKYRPLRHSTVQFLFIGGMVVVTYDSFRANRQSLSGVGWDDRFYERNHRVVQS